MLLYNITIWNVSGKKANSKNMKLGFTDATQNKKY